MAFNRHLLAATLAATALASHAGCGGSNSVTGTLQGTILDATTGARIGGTDLAVSLIQGVQVRAPASLHIDKTDALVGEYAFTSIPVTGGSVNGITSDLQANYKIVVVKAGYQRFEAEFAFSGNYAVDSKGVLAADTVYNKIGNIYLFPLGATAADYQVAVNYNTKPVSGLTVELVQLAGDNHATIDVGSGMQGAATNFGLSDGFNMNRLLPSSGLYPVLSATTDATGTAMFKGSGLVLGGQYATVVLPGKASDPADRTIQLAETTGTPFTEGVSVVQQTVTMKDAVPNENAAGLYIVSMTNSDQNSIQKDGVLKVGFSRPVSLYNAMSSGLGFSAAVNAAAIPGTTGMPPALTPLTTTGRPVDAALSKDGLTLTLTPNWDTAPDTSSYSDVAVTYGDGAAFVTTTDQPETHYQVLTNLKLANGSTPGNTVWMVGPRP